MNFSIGDVVQLKSGGPLMTVTDVGAGMDGTPMIDCVWFDKTEQKYGTFRAAVLKPTNT
jgi:uncharacterized protein YodC (DUF2158 family)